MMPENIEKNMYLRRRQGKITLLLYPKNTDNLWFLLKSRYYDARKYWKKHAKSHYYDTQNPKIIPPVPTKKGGVKPAQKMPKIGHFMYSKKRNRHQPDASEYLD